MFFQKDLFYEAGYFESPKQMFLLSDNLLCLTANVNFIRFASCSSVIYLSISSHLATLIEQFEVYSKKQLKDIGILFHF